MAEEYIEEDAEKKGFLDWLRSVFGRKEQEGSEEENAPKYNRKLLDGRIEKYLDHNMDAYIQEYGILTGLDLESYDLRYSNLTSRIADTKEYIIDADVTVTSMEKDLAVIQKAARKK